MSRMLLLGIFIVLFVDTVYRYCNVCDHFDGFKCRDGMKKCWKLNIFLTNRSCTTEHFYFNDRISGLYLFRYTKLSCKHCGSGMFQTFHDLLRETFCCNEKDLCNDGITTLETSSLFLEDIREKKELND